MELEFTLDTIDSICDDVEMANILRSAFYSALEDLAEHKKKYFQDITATNSERHGSSFPDLRNSTKTIKEKSGYNPDLINCRTGYTRDSITYTQNGAIKAEHQEGDSAIERMMSLGRDFLTITDWEQKFFNDKVNEYFVAYLIKARDNEFEPIEYEEKKLEKREDKTSIDALTDWANKGVKRLEAIRKKVEARKERETGLTGEVRGGIVEIYGEEHLEAKKYSVDKVAEKDELSGLEKEYRKGELSTEDRRKSIDKIERLIQQDIPNDQRVYLKKVLEQLKNPRKKRGRW